MKTILDWLEAAAALTPAKEAVSDPDTTLGYKELQEFAQRAGSFFAEIGEEVAQQDEGTAAAAPAAGVASVDASVDALAPAEPATTAATPHACSTRYHRARAVAFYLEKSAPALAAVLGAVYAGNFYSFLDLRQPRPRIQEICETLDPLVIICDEKSYEQAHEMIDTSKYRLVQLNDLFEHEISHERLRDIRHLVCDIDPLYVNFTSGSTGTPKGVVVSQRSVIDFIPVFCKTFGMDADDRFANQAPFDFDVSVKDIYSCLYLGASLEIIPRDYFSYPTKLMDYLVDRKVTTLVWAVSALSFVAIMNAFDYKTPQTIKRVLFSGEVMPIKQLKKWRRYLPHAQYVNLYGPTEITCNCTYYPITRDFEKGEVIPIGTPFDNERVFLLDENNQQILTPGVEGEICVSGTALGIGYLCDEAKTSAAFMQNPLQKAWLEPMYRTGDLGVLDEAGNFIYTSRKDHQIKHLGHRIELGDIESASMGIDGVEQAACTYDAVKHRLHLFYMGACEKDALGVELHKLLPQFMIPNTINKLDQLPLTKNGKIDRQALAATTLKKAHVPGKTQASSAPSTSSTQGDA